MSDLPSRDPPPKKNNPTSIVYFVICAIWTVSKFSITGVISNRRYCYLNWVYSVYLSVHCRSLFKNIPLKQVSRSMVVTCDSWPWPLPRDSSGRLRLRFAFRRHYTADLSGLVDASFSHVKSILVPCSVAGNQVVSFVSIGDTWIACVMCCKTKHLLHDQWCDTHAHRSIWVERPRVVCTPAQCERWWLRLWRMRSAQRRF